MKHLYSKSCYVFSAMISLFFKDETYISGIYTYKIKISADGLA